MGLILGVDVSCAQFWIRRWVAEGFQNALYVLCCSGGCSPLKKPR